VALSLLGASTVLFVGGLHAATRDAPQEAHGANARCGRDDRGLQARQKEDTVTDLRYSDGIAGARTMLALEANPAALQRRLPNGWELSPYAGEDLRRVKIDRSSFAGR
jgi:hypothetical protein